MSMYEATDLNTRDTYQFRTLDTLARRLAGPSGDYQVVHSETVRPPSRQVEILKRSRYADCGWQIVAIVSVPTEAVEAVNATDAL